MQRLFFSKVTQSVADFNPQAVCAAASGTNPEGTARTILFAAAIPRFRRGACLRG